MTDGVIARIPDSAARRIAELSRIFRALYGNHVFEIRWSSNGSLCATAVDQSNTGDRGNHQFCDMGILLDMSHQSDQFRARKTPN